MTIVLNSVGPLFVMGLTAPMVALWNRAPLPGPASDGNKSTEPGKPRRSDGQVKGESTLAAL